MLRTLYFCDFSVGSGPPAPSPLPPPPTHTHSHWIRPCHGRNNQQTYLTGALRVRYTRQPFHVPKGWKCTLLDFANQKAVLVVVALNKLITVCRVLVVACTIHHRAISTERYNIKRTIILYGDVFQVFCGFELHWFTPFFKYFVGSIFICLMSK